MADVIPAAGSPPTNTPANCAGCMYGQRFQTVQGQKVRVCSLRAPLPISMASGPTTVLWPPVTDDDWCGEGIAA